MAKVVLTNVNNSSKQQIRKKGRKSLQTLQLSAANRILTGSNFIQPILKALPCKIKQSKAVEKVVVTEKENAPILRCSKRKISTTFDAKNNANSPLKPKIKRSSAKNVQNLKTKSKAASKFTKEHSVTVINEDNTNLSQNKLNFSPFVPVIEDQDVFGSTNPDKTVLIISPSGVTEDNDFESTTRIFDQSTGTQFNRFKQISQPGPFSENEISEVRLKKFKSILSKLFIQHHVQSIPVTDLVDFMIGQKLRMGLLHLKKLL